MLRYFFSISFIIFLAFAVYVSTYYKSGINTLRGNPNNDTISYKIITDDLSQRKDYFTWIGQATILLNIDDKTILFDPIFSERASPLKNIGPKRNIPPAISIENLPEVDLIVISHNHYDHLDLQALKEIQNKYPLVNIFVPKGDLKLLKNIGLENINEFEWWENQSIFNFSVTFVPTKHWSARGLFDRNKSLWGGWHIKDKDYSMYHAGDTGYSRDFIDTKLRLGSPKYAFIPIGAYDPEWFMSSSHVNPEDAVQIMIDLEAEKAFGMHWATFVLTDEDTIDPKLRLNKALKDFNNLDFMPLSPGQIIRID